MDYDEPEFVSTIDFSTERPSPREEMAKMRQTIERTAIMVMNGLNCMNNLSSGIRKVVSKVGCMLVD